MKRIGLIGILTILAFPVHANQVESFISTFGKTCPSFGANTKTALAMNQSLVDLIESLRDDENCSAVYNSLNSLKLLGDNLQYLDSSRQEIKDREIENEFLASVLKNIDFAAIGDSFSEEDIIGSLPFDNLVETIGHSFLSVQEVKLDQDRDEYDRRREIDSVVAGYLGQLRNAIHQSSSCMVGHPNLPAQMIAQGLTLAGSYSQSQWGAAVAVAGSILGELLEYFRTAKFDRAIKETNRAAFYQAVSCGIESITEQYCGAMDAKEFLRVRVDSLDPDYDRSNNNAWNGIRLLRKNYPKLKGWFSKIKDGVGAINREQARRIIAVEQKNAKRKEVGHFISGEKSYFEERLSQTNDPNVIQGIVQTFLRRVSEFALMSGSSDVNRQQANPYLEQFPVYGACMFMRSSLYGLGSVPVIPVGSDCEAELQRDFSQTWNFNDVAKNISDIHKAVKSAVSAEKNKVIGDGADPQSLWLEATSEDSNGNQNLNTLSRLEDYLQNIKSRWIQIRQNDPQNRSKYLDFQLEFISDILANVIRPAILLIEAPLEEDGNGNPMTYTEKLQVLSKSLRLGTDTDYLFFRMVGFIRVDINERIKSGEINEEIADLIRLAANEYVNDLTKGSNEYVHQVYEDLAHAITIGQQTLESYMGLFDKHVGDGIDHFLDLSRRAGETIDPTKPDPIAHVRYFNASKLCMQALTKSGSRSKSEMKKIEKSCGELVYYSPVYKVDPQSISFSELKQKSWNERVCALHKFNQKIKIFELNSRIQKGPIQLMKASFLN